MILTPALSAALFPSCFSWYFLACFIYGVILFRLSGPCLVNHFTKVDSCPLPLSLIYLQQRLDILKAAQCHQPPQNTLLPSWTGRWAILTRLCFCQKGLDQRILVVPPNPLFYDSVAHEARTGFHCREGQLLRQSLCGCGCRAHAAVVRGPYGPGPPSSHMH